MWTLLFLVAAIIFFVLWNDSKQQIKEVKKTEYDKGYSAGYWALADRLAQSGSDFDIEKFKQEIGADSRVASPQATEQAEYFVESDVDVPELRPEVPPKDHSARNLNVLLFVSSMLFVAAGAAFVSTAMPDGIKLLGIWALVAAFYAVGLFLQDSEKLRPAGVAFAGTGLGLLPFAGVALYQLAHMPGEIVWLITSLVGVVAYFYAAITMKSQVVSYLTLAFVLSFAASLSNAVALPMVWSFVAIIAVSLLLNLVAYAFPEFMPEVFRKPTEVSEQSIVPLTAIGSLFFVDSLSLRSYELIVGASLAYYVVVWLQTNLLLYRHIVRGLAQILVLLVAWDVAADATVLGITLAVTAVVQQIITLLLNSRESVQARWIWFSLMQFAMFIAPMFWLGSENADTLLVIDYIVLGLLSAAATLQFRKAVAAAPGVIASIVVPFVVGRVSFDPPLDLSVLASWFMFSAATVILGRMFAKNFHPKGATIVLDASVIIYIAIAWLLAIDLDAAAAIGILAASAGLFWLNSYVSNRPFMSILGNVGFVFTVARICDAANVASQWQALVVFAIAGAVLYTAMWYMLMRNDDARAMGLLGTFWVLGVVSATLSFFDPATKMVAASAVVLLAGTLAIEGKRKKRQAVIEAAAYIATFGLQRMFGIAVDDVSLVVYAHWWALTIFAMGKWRHAGEGRTQIALGFVTASSGIYALAEGGVYQLLFLVEQLVLLIFGATRNRQWAIWWGLIGSVLAVLWFLKDLAFAALGFLGLVVIGIVIWRLNAAGHHPTTRS